MAIKNVVDIYPLSPMQELMLFHCLAHPQQSTLTEQLVCTLEGNLDTAIFEHAWNETVARHSILRTAFVWENIKQPHQIVRKQVSLPWHVHRCIDQPDVYQTIEHIKQERRTTGFDLTKAPLMCCDLVQTDEDRFTLIWTYHHLIMDGWSLSILFKEIFASYTALATDSSVNIPSIPPFRNYIEWLKQQSLYQAEYFWRTTLQDWQNPLIVQAIAVTDTVDGTSTCSITLSETETSALNDLTREQGITLSILLQGALALVLAAQLQVDDVVFGLTVSGRPVTLEDSESMLGMFINNVPMRFKLDYSMPVIKWLHGLGEILFNLNNYAYVPLESIGAWSGLSDSSNLFNILFLFENYPIDTSLQQDDDFLRLIDVEGGIETNYSLTIISAPGTKLQLHASFDPDKFSVDAVNSVLDDLCMVLRQILDDPQVLVNTLLQCSGVPVIQQVNLNSQASLQSYTPLNPRSPVELQILEIWERMLNVKGIGVRDNFFTLGGNSLMLLSMVNQVQNIFNQPISIAALFPETTIEAMACLLETKVQSEWSALIPLQEQGSKPPFFCVHPVYGSALCYLPLMISWDKEQPFYGIQAHGLNGSPPLTTVEAMAQSYVAELQHIQPQGPYFLGGHCSGALVAFEMARQLRAANHEVALLTLMDAPPPIPGVTDVAVSKTMELLALAEVVELFYGQSLHLPEPMQDSSSDIVSLLEAWPLEQQLNYLAQEMKRVGFLPQSATVNELKTILDVVVAIRSAYNQYRPQPLTDVPAIVLRALEVPDLLDPQLKKVYTQSSLGWEALLPSMLTTADVPGNHVTMLTYPHSQVLVDVLHNALLQAEQLIQGV